MKRWRHVMKKLLEETTLKYEPTIIKSCFLMSIKKLYIFLLTVKLYSEENIFFRQA